MPELKLVINDPKTGKSYSKTHDLDLSGVKIGDKVSGQHLGLNDYEFQFTGGSDSSGFPMRKDINSPNRKSALLGSGPGVHAKRNGEKLRKTVRGNTIGAKITQVNLKIIKQGKDAIDKALGIEPKAEKKEEPKTEEKKIEEKPKEEIKETPKEEVKEEKKEAPKVEEKKEEVKPEVKEEKAQEVKAEEKKEEVKVQTN